MLASPSLNHLIRPGQQRRRNRQAERLGGLEVDGDLEPRRLLYGEVGGLRAFEDSIDIVRSPGCDGRQTWTERHQSPFRNQFSKAVYRRQTVLCDKLDHLLAVRKEQAVWGSNEPLRLLSLKPGKRPLEILGTPKLNDRQSDPQ